MAGGKFKGIEVNGEVDLSSTTIAALGGLIPAAYDYTALTYVASGNGVGEIQTVTYKTGGAGGTTVAVLTIAYDSSHRITSVTKT